MKKSPNEILKTYWGYESLRPAQEQVITAVLEKKDVIALLPTGGGKSICFQIPALAKEGICIVVSPLIALMQDQVEALNRKGIKAMMISGGISFSELDTMLDNCIYGNYKFLYLSPERLQQDIVQQRIQQMKVNLIAVDEAHCISEWGHDFRPSYRNIKILKELQPLTNIIALTATATHQVIADINEILELQDAEIIKYSFERKNIAFTTKKSEDKNFELLQFLQKNPGVSIIYVRNRKATLELRQLLSQNKIPAEAYHGGISSEEKKKLLESWLAEKYPVMVATTAFGMGIDKANVRNVIHFHLPESLESFFQEAGRAGRDGKESKAILIYNESDISRLQNQFLKVLPTPESVKLIYKKLNTYFSIAFGEGQQTSHNFNFFEFCKTYELNTTITYNSLLLLDRSSILSLSREYHQRTELQFTISNKQLYYFLERNPRYEELVKTLLRTQGGYFDYKTSINISVLSKKTGLSIPLINNLLNNLHKEEIIDLSIADQDTTITFLVPREDETTINPIIPYIEQQYKNKEQKINSVLHYLKNDEICKTVQILSYFGEKETTPCGKCSVCLTKNKTPKASKKELVLVYNSIIEQLKKSELNSKDLVAQLDFSEENIIMVLQLMLDKQIITVTPKNTYTLRR